MHASAYESSILLLPDALLKKGLDIRLNLDPMGQAVVESYAEAAVGLDKAFTWRISHISNEPLVPGLPLNLALNLHC